MASPAPARADRGADISAIATALALAAVSVFPVFLTGALGVQLGGAFGLDAGALGLSVSAYFLASACTVALVGRVVERVGVRAGIVWGAGLAALSLLGAAVAPNRAVLTGALMIGGIGNAVVGPTTSVLLSQVSVDRRGLGFGAKQAAIMVASLLGGVALPSVGLLLGWRWVYAFGVALAASVAVLGRPRRVSPPIPVASPGPEPRRPALAPLAIGFGLGTAASTALGVLLIGSLVAAGLSEGAAGLVLALGSVATIGTRVASGWYVDRAASRAPTSIIVGMLVVGAMGFLLMASNVLPVVLVGVLLAFAAGWGWTGLLVQVIATRAGRGPAAATGIGQTGAAVGGIVGPSLLGATAVRWSYGAAWVVAAMLLSASALSIELARRRLAHGPGSSRRGERPVLVCGEQP